MSGVMIGELARRVQERRSGKGVREAAVEVGVSPATLSRVENGGVPDLETFGRICRWLGDDPARYLGLRATESGASRTARVHFKKGTAIKPDSARALSELILATQQALLAEDLDE